MPGLIGFDPTALAGNLPGALNPGYGVPLAGGIAEGVRSALQAFQDERKNQRDIAQQALNNQMNKKLYQMKLFEAGLQENPDATQTDKPFGYSPEAMQMQMYKTQLGNIQEARKTILGAEAKRFEEGRAGLGPEYKQELMDVATGGGGMEPFQQPKPPGYSAPNAPAPTGAQPPTGMMQPQSIGQPTDAGLLAQKTAPPGLLGSANAPATTKGAPVPALPPPPGGLSLDLQKKQAEIANMQAENRKKNLELSDPVAGIGEASKKQVNDLVGDIGTYRNALNGVNQALATLSNPKASDDDRLSTAEAAINLLAKDKEGRPDPKLREELHRNLEMYRAAPPNIGVGRDYDAFAKQMANRKEDLENKIEAAKQQAKNIAPKLSFPQEAMSGMMAGTRVPPLPKVGEVRNGRKYLGGNPGISTSWSERTAGSK